MLTIKDRERDIAARRPAKSVRFLEKRIKQDVALLKERLEGDEAPKSAEASYQKLNKVELEYWRRQEYMSDSKIAHLTVRQTAEAKIRKLTSDISKK